MHGRDAVRTPYVCETLHMLHACVRAESREHFQRESGHLCSIMPRPQNGWVSLQSLESWSLCL